MIIGDLPPEHKRWDHHRAFHWQLASNDWATAHAHNTLFTVFETGEVIVRGAHAAPDDRRKYGQLGLELLLTSDNCPKLVTPDGVPIPNAWLTDGGGQTLLLDVATSLVYGLYQHKEDEKQLLNRGVPSRFITRHWPTLGAYFPGPGREPVAAPVTMAVPHSHKILVSDEERQHVETLVNVARAEHALSGEALPKYYGGIPPLNWATASATSDWRTLDDKHKTQLITTGVSRKHIELPYAMLAG